MSANRGTGPGAQTSDGSSVELYKMLPHLGEANIIHSALREQASVLELGCGVGRVTHPLIALGHAVTAVDFSREMLDEIRGAQAVFADIADLRLNRKFDGVVLGSTLINANDDELRQRFLATCAHHVAEQGRVIVECHAESLIERAVPGYLGSDSGIRISWLNVCRDGDVVSGTLEYRFDQRIWTHTFSTRFLDEQRIKAALKEAGLQFDGWLNERRTWFCAA